MPLYLEKRVGKCHIAVWQMTETVNELFSLTRGSEKLTNEVDRFHSETRKKEWLTVRILLNAILQVAHPDEIIYDEKGKPHLPSERGYISFSHTKNFAAIIYHPEKIVGIDIETVHPRIEKISDKFINLEESTFIQGDKQTETLHIVWGVKEVLFKIYGKGGVDFKKHLHVHPFKPMTDGTVDAEISKDNTISTFAIQYFFSEHFLLVYGSS